jgi:transcription elongation factor Elf1|tara:strand:- start:337 stop:555 length:219 start_codon:yes stop_codon:yes gene_type:complete
MAKLKKYRTHKAICNDCNGNGYVQCGIKEGREHIVLQCKTCDSEGEIYVDESEVVEFYVDADTPSSDVGKLH